MTIEQAVEILNREQHERWDTWFAMGRHVYGDGEVFTQFEAVAIAEKYDREKPRMPQIAESKADSKTDSKAEQVARRIWLAAVGEKYGITK